MIRVRLFSTSEMVNASVLSSSSETSYKVCCYEVNSFYRILNGNAWSKKKYPPFRDKESIGLMKFVDGAELVENDWYSMVTYYGRTCLSALCSGTKYGLTVIANSKKGIYTTYKEVGENVFQYLQGLKMDILIAYKKEDVSETGHLPFKICPYILENFEYEGKEVEALVESGLDSVKELEDGTLKISPWQDKFAYNWLSDLSGVLDNLDAYLCMLESTKVLMQPVKEFDYLEYGNLIQSHGTNVIDDFDCSMELELLEEEKSLLTEKEREEWFNRITQMPDWEEREYWHSVKIMNHLVEIPEESLFKYLPYLVIKYIEKEGYFIYNDVSVKYPEFEEAFLDNRERMLGNNFKLAIVLDVNNEVTKSEQVIEVMYGFKFSEGRVEVFDKKTALVEFKDTLSKALSSGKCKVGKIVYDSGDNEYVFEPYKEK